MLTGEFGSMLVFFLAFVPWIGYLFVATFFLLSITYGRCSLYKATPLPSHSSAPGVSIIKPLMGLDDFLPQNLETHFTLQFAKFELLFCVHTADDPAIRVVKELQQKYPHVNTRLFIGGKNGILNPMVNNMVPAYEASTYDVIWVASSRVQVNTDMLLDMVGKLETSGAALVHQMPFVAHQPGLSAAVEKVFFGCVQARYYLALHVMGFNCFTGMSYLVRKSELDKVKGLAHYGKYLAEDFFFSKRLHSKGFKHKISAYPAIQRVANTTFTSYRDRMIRWSRLRMNMLPVISAILEPIIESITLGLYMSWSMYHFFSIHPAIWLTGHMTVWCILDYIQFSGIQREGDRLSIIQFVRAWFIRECLSLYIYIRALSNVRHIRWGRRVFRLSHFGRGLERVNVDDCLPV